MIPFEKLTGKFPLKGNLVKPAGVARGEAFFRDLVGDASPAAYIDRGGDQLPVIPVCLVLKAAVVVEASLNQVRNPSPFCAKFVIHLAIYNTLVAFRIIDVGPRRGPRSVRNGQINGPLIGGSYLPGLFHGALVCGKRWRLLALNIGVFLVKTLKPSCGLFNKQPAGFTWLFIVSISYIVQFAF